MKSTRKKYEDFGRIQKWRRRRELLHSDVIEVSNSTKEEVINTKIAEIQDDHSESDNAYMPNIACNVNTIEEDVNTKSDYSEQESELSDENDQYDHDLYVNSSKDIPLRKFFSRGLLTKTSHMLR